MIAYENKICVYGQKNGMRNGNTFLLKENKIYFSKVK